MAKDNTIVETYLKKYRDGSLSLAGEYARHQSAYLSTAKNGFEAFTSAHFEINDIAAYRKLLENPALAEAFDRDHMRLALEAPHKPSAFCEAQARAVALHVASPGWEYREAYCEALDIFRDTGGGAGLGSGVFTYNMGWVAGLIINYGRSLVRRHSILKRAGKWMYWRSTLGVLLGGAAIYAFTNPFPLSPLVLGVAALSVCGVAYLNDSAVKTALRKRTEILGGFTGAARDASQKRRNAVQHVLEEAGRLETALLYEVDKANDSAWRQGNVRDGAGAREFLTRAARRANLFRRKLEAQARSACKVAEMAYAGFSAEAEYEANFVFAGPLGHVSLTVSRWMYRVLLAAAVLGVAAKSVALCWPGLRKISPLEWTAHPSVPADAWLVLIAAGLVAILVTAWRGTLRLESALKEPDMHGLFADLIDRATPPNAGKSEPRYEEERTNLAVADAVKEARDFDRGR